MRWQERDSRILKDIQFIGDGVLSRRQIMMRHWPAAKTPRAMERRLALLKASAYISWPTQKERKTEPIPYNENIVWLDWKGILFIANEILGLEIDPPKTARETQLRSLEKSLRDRGVRWLRKPKWLTLNHDLKVVDFYLAIERSVQELPNLTIETWLPESRFRKEQLDEVEYHFCDREGKWQTDKKGVFPDGFVRIADQNRMVKGDSYKARFLLEVDNANHSAVKFALERAAPGAAYIQSPVYKAYFEYNSGAWLAATTSDRRMHSLIKETGNRVGAGARYYFFTTFDRLSANLFTQPIWWRPGRSEPWVLMPSNA
jgi:hypothetical protein